MSINPCKSPGKNINLQTEVDVDQLINQEHPPPKKETPITMTNVALIIDIQKVQERLLLTPRGEVQEEPKARVFILEAVCFENLIQSF